MKNILPSIFVHIVKVITPKMRSLDLLKNIGTLWILRGSQAQFS